jgi:hypothetical protein
MPRRTSPTAVAGRGALACAVAAGTRAVRNRSAAASAATRAALVCAFAMALAVAFPLTVRAQSPADAPRAAWTLIFYLAADNDLEAAQVQDLREMLAVGGTADVNVVVLADRSPTGTGKYTNDAVANVPNWTTAKVFAVERGKLRELADWGELNTGDPATLDRLLQLVAKDFPAARYGVVFGNHGLGWPGTAVDESSHNDSLTTLELASVLKPFVGTHGKFELIGFDSCLMGNLEVAKAMAPFGRAMVASEEIEPDDGWDYTAVLGALTATPTLSGADLGTAIVDSFHAQFARSQSKADTVKGITLGVIALDRIAPLEQAVARLAAAVDASVSKGGREAWLRVARARNETESYGRAAAAQNPEVYDLADAAANLKKQTADPAIAAAADAVVAATKSAVVHAVRGEARPQASGLSLFFPPDEKVLGARGETAYDETGFAQANRWYPWLRNYTSVAERDTQKPELAAVSTSAAAKTPDQPVEIESTLRADDLEEAQFVLALAGEGGNTIIGSIPVEPADGGKLAEAWDGAWFAIGDGARHAIVPIAEVEELDEENDVYWASVPVQVKLAGTREWLDVTAYFELDFQGEDVKGEFVYAVAQSGNVARELDLDEGDEVRPVYLHLADDGTETFGPATDPALVLHVGADEDLTIERMRVAPGAYRLGFVAWDLAGNVSAEYADVEVE